MNQNLTHINHESKFDPYKSWIKFCFLFLSPKTLCSTIYQKNFIAIQNSDLVMTKYVYIVHSWSKNVVFYLQLFFLSLKEFDCNEKSKQENNKFNYWMQLRKVEYES